MDLTPTTIGRYLEALNTGKLPAPAWLEMAHALGRLGVTDVEIIRPVVGPPPRREDLLPLVARFSKREQLEALAEIIDADHDARAILRVYLKGILDDVLPRRPET
jgi:hypothetical protein